jgi:hypothetical protein
MFEYVLIIMLTSSTVTSISGFATLEDCKNTAEMSRKMMVRPDEVKFVCTKRNRNA